MNLDNNIRPVLVKPTRALYKWSNIFNRLQRNFFVDNVKLRREKQIEDFIILNGFKNVKFKIDTDVFRDFQIKKCNNSQDADIVVITDQKFSRYPCPVIIEKIIEQLDKCPNLYLCINRHYINIDNSYHDTTLDTKFTVAITQWLKKSLPDYNIIDLSNDYIDYGRHFTWAIPDRHFFIQRNENN